ncbi:hypothetical protein EJ110_NYTH47366 [Nymphaea thermarum]|nr:hypothetical protein EJ110_NYTH47366 [Nymphaea thermarum]
MSVIGHQKEHVIEENKPVEKSGKYSSWKGDNNIVMSLIMNSVQPQIASTIAYYTSAKQMWDFLKQTYSNDRNISEILQVEEELLNLQEGDQSLAQYFASLKSVSDRLKALRPPSLTCYKTHVAKAQMLTGAEIPDLAEAYNRLSRLAVTLSSPASDIHASALVASGGRGRGLFRGRGMGRGSGGGRGRFHCTYCGKIGHLEDRCWDKHGRPTAAPSLGRNVTSKLGKNSLQYSNGAAQAASSVVDGSLSSSQPETVTVSINNSGLTLGTDRTAPAPDDPEPSTSAPISFSPSPRPLWLCPHLLLLHLRLHLPCLSPLLHPRPYFLLHLRPHLRFPIPISLLLLCRPSCPSRHPISLLVFFAPQASSPSFNLSPPSAAPRPANQAICNLSTLQLLSFLFSSP